MKRDIDNIIEVVRKRFPTVGVDQLQVSHAGDDDGIWFFSFFAGDDIQIESPTGMCPFIVESNIGEAKHGKTVDEVAALVCEYLSTAQKDIPDWNAFAEYFPKFLRFRRWPGAVRWVFREDMLVRGTRVLVGPTPGEQAALIKKVFEEGRCKGLMEVQVIALSANTVIATVWYPKLKNEEVLGWSHGFKLSVRNPLLHVTVVPLALWALIRRTPSYRRYQQNEQFLGTREWAAM